jgi:transposase-like protein
MKNSNIYAGYRYPAQIISHAVWLYHRFTLSFRDIEEFLATRGVGVSYETIRSGAKNTPLSSATSSKRIAVNMVIAGIWMRFSLK